MKIHTHVQIAISIILVISISSCENDFKENLKNKVESNTLENIKLVDSTIQIKDISTLKNIIKSYKINFVEQNEFINEIKNLQDEGFKPLVPLLGENDTKKEKSLF